MKKVRYIILILSFFCGSVIESAPTKNKSQRNRQTRQTSKRRPIQRRPMQRGRNGRGPSRGGGTSTTPTATPVTPSTIKPTPSLPPQTQTPIALQPLDISWLKGKTITLSTDEKKKATEKRQTLEKMKSELKKAKKGLENIRAEYFPTTTDIEKKVNRALDKQRKEKKNNTNAKERQ
jgi:hypothetical protein